MTSIDEYQGKPVLAKRLADLQKVAWESFGSLTLWIGAGFGKLYAGLPVWAELLQRLSSDVKPGPERELALGLIQNGRLQVAAELLSEIRSDRLADHVCRIFATPNVKTDTNPLCYLHPGTVVTTNYDTLLDQVFPEYRVVGPQDSMESIFNFAPKLVKLHGSVNDPARIVLNVTSYAKTYNKELEWFLAHIFQNTTVLFVGASLSRSEPYMRFIELLNRAKLLRNHHFAIRPFLSRGTESLTNKAIQDYSNELETLGIRTLPYIVESPSDHEFVDLLLRELQPRKQDALNKVLEALDAALQLYGPENIGPAVFRLRATLDTRYLQQRPFLNLTTKFLRSLRDAGRTDLGKLWNRYLVELIKYHEIETRRVFSEEFAHHGGTSRKAAEISANKAFIYDSTSPK